MVAEELVFGKEYTTSSATSDINLATGYLMDLYKTAGFGSTPVFYANTSIDGANGFHQVTDMEEEVKELILEGKKLAEQTLKKEMTLLLRMADVLADQTRLKKSEIERLVIEYSSSGFTAQEPENYYRNKVKGLVGALNHTKVYKPYTIPKMLNTEFK